MEVYLSGISRVKAVNSFFVVDGNGTTIFCKPGLKKNTAAHIKLSKTIAACGNTCLSLSPGQFKYLCFLRGNKTQVLIFPFGGYFLGVIAGKQAQNTGSRRIARQILSILAKAKP